MEAPHSVIEFAKQNFVQLGIFFMGVIGILIGTQGRKDKHAIDKATKFNIDVDTLNDSFDLSQKLLKSLRIQLDQTQTLLNNANAAYDLLDIELVKAKAIIAKHEAMIITLKLEKEVMQKENKILMETINTCEFNCKHKNPKKIKLHDSNN